MPKGLPTAIEAQTAPITVRRSHAPTTTFTTGDTAASVPAPRRTVHMLVLCAKSIAELLVVERVAPGERFHRLFVEFRVNASKVRRGFVAHLGSASDCVAGV